MLAVLVFSGVYLFASAQTASYDITVRMSATNASGRLYPYQSTNFSVLLDNNGSTAVSGLIVAFYLNGAELRHYVVNLPAGVHGAALAINYTFPGSGNYTFKVQADPGSLLNLKDRASAQSTVNLSVLAPQSPSDVYNSLPGNGIASTQSFTLYGNLGTADTSGPLAAAATAEKYYIPHLDSIFSPGQNMVIKLYENLYGFIRVANGAYIAYKNGTRESTTWLQGTINPKVVDGVLSTFGANKTSGSVNGVQVASYRINSTASICVYYDRGWTKMVTLSNSTTGQTCLSIAGNRYNSNESAVLISALRGDRNLTSYQRAFVYRNSTALGTSLAYSSNGLAAVNIFGASHFFFVSAVEAIRSSFSNSTNAQCRGLVYNSNGTHVCSRYLLPRDGKVPQNFGLVGSSSVYPNYTFTIYSLVNASSLGYAHVSAVGLVQSLGITQPSMSWTNGFRNSCSFRSNQSFGCRVNSYDYSNSIANISISNKLSSAIRVNTLACFFPGNLFKVKVNATLAANATASYKVPCMRIPIPAVGIVTSYILAMNYTYNGANATASGVLNTTSPGVG